MDQPSQHRTSDENAATSAGTRTVRDGNPAVPGATMEFSDTKTGDIARRTADLSFSVDDQASTAERMVIADSRVELPGYTITGLLGRGGMGVVYQAWHQKLGRFVAIKMLLAGEHAGPEHLARFRTEAQAVASLQHPNIVQIYDVDEHNAVPYFSLEFVPGGSLAQKIAGKPQLPADSAQLVETIARAIHCAHKLGIVHRDLKPANILLAYSDHSSATSLDPLKQKLLSEGPLRNAIPKIGDFGLAKRLEVDSRQTRSGTILGSPSYMAPEQARGDVGEVGPLADVYAMGTILYELLTGRPPFMAASAIDTLAQVVNVEPVPPSRLAPNVPRDLETICLKCLQKDPRKRYESAESLADDLQRFQRGEPIYARPVSSAERLWRWCQRNPWLAGATGSAVTAMLLALVVLVWKNHVIEQEKAAALKAKGEAEEQRGIAQAHERDAVKAKELEEEAKKDAIEQKELAIKSEKLATEQSTENLETIQFVIQEMNKQLSEIPGTQAVRKKLIELVEPRINKVANNIKESTSKEATMVAALEALGIIYEEIGATETAWDFLIRAGDIARERMKIRNYSDSSRWNMANVSRDLGQLAQEFRRDMPSALKYYEDAVDWRTDILDNPYAGSGNAKNPLVVKKYLAEDHVRVATTIFRLGDPASALGHFQTALDLRRELTEQIDDPELRQDHARSILSIGEMKFRLGEPDAAKQFYSEGLNYRERLVADAPEKLKLKAKHELARTHGNFGELYLHTNELPGAREHFEQCRMEMEWLAQEDSSSISCRRDLALAYYRLGTYANRAHDFAAAAGWFGKALDIRKNMADRDPMNDKRKMELMLSLARCGDHTKAAELADKFAEPESADNELLVDVGRTLAQCAASVPDQKELQTDYTNRAIAAVSKAVAHGYRDRVYLQVEPDFDPIQHHPAFANLFATNGDK